MAELMDPTVAYLLVGIVLVAGVVGAGILAAGHAAVWISAAILLGILGFVLGAYTAGTNSVMWSMFLVVAGIALILSYFLPLELEHGLIITGIGFLFGARVPR